jgi:hypothetical protein
MGSYRSAITVGSPTAAASGSYEYLLRIPDQWAYREAGGGRLRSHLWSQSRRDRSDRCPVVAALRDTVSDELCRSRLRRCSRHRLRIGRHRRHRCGLGAEHKRSHLPSGDKVVRPVPVVGRRVAAFDDTSAAQPFDVVFEGVPRMAPPKNASHNHLSRSPGRVPVDQGHKSLAS